MTQEAIVNEITKAITQDPSHSLKNFAVIYSQPVAWGDMDAFSHVNNVVYYTYAQNARIYYNQKLGLFTQDTASVLVASACQYLKPVTYPDTLWIGVRVKKIGSTSLTHEYLYYSASLKAVVAMGESVLVYLDKDTGAKKPIAEDKKTAIAKLENNVH